MVDFNILQTPDFVGGAINALKAGQQDRQAADRRNVLASTAPADLPNALLHVGDLQGAGQAQAFNANADAQAYTAETRAANVAATQRQAQLRDALGKGDVQAARALAAGDENLTKAVDTYTQHLTETAQTLASVGKTLKALPYDQRKTALAHMAPGLAQRGLDEKQITGFDPTDDNIDAQITSVTTLAEQAARDKGVVVPGGASLVGQDGKPLFTAPEKPEYRTVTNADGTSSVVLVNAPQGGPPPTGQAPPSSGSHTEPGVVAGVLAQAIPGLKVTSGVRSQEHNTEVGGVPNSMHLGGQAIDVVLPKGVTAGTVHDILTAQGLSPTEFINEGDHLHIGWRDKPGAASASGGNVVATGTTGAKVKPQYRAATPQEVASVGLPPGTPAQISPEGKVEPLPAGTSLKALPASIGKNMADTRTSMARIDSALSALDKYPQGVGLQNVAGDTVMQRLDPKGVDVRSLVANVGSQLIHDRSGAAVTISETPRLKPFVPAATDSAETIKKKLTQLRDILQTDLDNVQEEFGPNSGYRASPVTPAKPAPPPARKPAPPSAVAYLKQNPALSAHFDAKYGAGAAARAMGR